VTRFPGIDAILVHLFYTLRAVTSPPQLARLQLCQWCHTPQLARLQLRHSVSTM